MGAVKSYKDLQVWQEGVRICTAVYRLTSVFPVDERFGLVSQLRRCSVSIPSNIAEGHAHDSTRDYLRHLSFASGLLAEVETQLVIARELGFSDETQLSDLRSMCEGESKMLTGLQRSLRQRLSQ